MRLCEKVGRVGESDLLECRAVEAIDPRTSTCPARAIGGH